MNGSKLTRDERLQLAQAREAAHCCDICDRLGHYEDDCPVFYDAVFGSDAHLEAAYEDRYEEG